MRPEDLLQAMSEIDDGLVVRSSKKKTIPWKSMLAMAACLILLVGIAIPIVSTLKAPRTMEVALFYSPSSDQGTSYEKAALEALSAYYGDYDLQYTYYKETSADDRMAQIDAAISAGCRLALLDGRQEGQTLLTVAKAHPDTTFLALGVSAEELGQAPLPENVICIGYRPEIAGYLAGYTTVKEGYTELGYYYDAGIPAYFAYGSGYLQGIEAAAQELGITDRIRIRVSSTADPAPDSLADLSEISMWYMSGTQMVLACGPTSCNAAEEAAKNEKGDVILVGDRPTAEETKEAISQGIADILDKILHNELEQDNIGEMPYYTLNNPDGSWGFQNVSEEEFAALRDSLINGTRPCMADMVNAEDYSIAVLFS